MSPTRAFPPILAAATAFCACSSGDPELEVRLTLDGETCGAYEPEMIRLDCSGMMGVWLRDEAADATLGQACVNVPPTETLDKLTTEHLDGADLPTTSKEAVRVEVAVYSNWTVADGCVRPIEFPAEGPPQIIMSGSSEPVTLADSNGRLDIALGCESDNIVTRGEIKDCEDDCADAQEQCNTDDVFNACHARLIDCIEPACLDRACLENCMPNDAGCRANCADQTCVNMCFVDTFFPCVDITPTRPCERDLYPCLVDCKGNLSCEAECKTDAEECRVPACQGVFDDCSTKCEDRMECASVAAGS